MSFAARAMFSSGPILASSLAFSGQTYAFGGEGIAECTLTIKTDGSWEVTGFVDQTSGTPNSGTWLVGGSASGAHVRFTRTANSGTCGSSSASTGWLAMTTDRGVTVTASAGGTACSRTATYLVEFSTDGGATVGLSASLTLAAGAAAAPPN